MVERILYLIGVVAVGWAVTFFLRALPFLIFAGRNRALPSWVERVGNIISPAIIAGLIIYSYSGLEWRTAWPYLAGVLTVGLHLWKKNALASIIVGTVVYMLLLTVGCVSAPAVSVDASDPSVIVRADGIYLGDSRVESADVASALEQAEIPQSRAIHILLEEGVKDLGPARQLMQLLANAGYTRSVLVTKRHAESEKLDATEAARRRTARRMTVRSPVSKKVRYKGANE